MSEEFIPTLTHATERDIDLILVEELHASLEFSSFIAEKAGIGLDIASTHVLHSKRRTRNRREIDIFLELHHNDGSKSALLIENKLDATEQPDQAESYQDEANVLANQYERCKILIVCPNSYSNQHSDFIGKFDAIVTYENIGEYFQTSAANSTGATMRRMAFRKEVLLQAIQKGRRGYTPIPNKIIGDFNAQYVQMLSILAPEIVPGASMLKAANPDESTSMIYDAKKTFAKLEESIRPKRFAHELGRGQSHRANYVSLVFAGWGHALPGIVDTLEAEAAEINASFSASKPTKKRPNPGLVMRVTTIPVDNQGSFGDQESQIEMGILVAKRVRAWLHKNTEIVEGWKRLVEAPSLGEL